MARRSELQVILESICENVYFQPPSNIQMKYPAIVYERGRANTKFADNNPYGVVKNYSLKVISKNPDENIFDPVSALPMCAHERFFVLENLNHDVFSIYF